MPFSIYQNNSWTLSEQNFREIEISVYPVAGGSEALETP